MPKPVPTLDTETGLWLAGYRVVAGMDEVGRGAWAGPIMVGVATVTAECGPFPDGLTDSKALTTLQREKILPATIDWVFEWAVGAVSPVEVDELGVYRALGVAGRRALAALTSIPDIVVLDGDTDFLTPRGGETVPGFPPVLLMEKADARCASVSAASVIAKQERDGLMVAFDPEFPAYGFAANKGYGGAAVHQRAVREYGLTRLHRLSWRIPRGARPVGHGNHESVD